MAMGYSCRYCGSLSGRPHKSDCQLTKQFHGEVANEQLNHIFGPGPEKKVDNSCPMCGQVEVGRTKYVDVGYFSLLDNHGATGTERVAFRDLPKWLTENPGRLIHTITDLS